MTTHYHLLTDTKVDEFVSGTKVETTILTSEGFGLHFILGYQHIELETYCIRLRQT